MLYPANSYIKGHFAVRKKLLTILLTLSLLLVVGCRNLNKGLMKRIYAKDFLGKGKVTYTANTKYQLTDTKLKEMVFYGAVKIEDVTVIYQYGLNEQADYIARQVKYLISNIEEKTGLEIRYGVNVHLLRLDEIPQSYTMKFKSDPNNFRIPLLVEAGNESCEAVISQNFVYPGILIHELAEMSLTTRKDKGVILPDATWGGFFLKGKILNYTRWFREGFANYAGFLALETASSDINYEYTQAHLKIHSHPLSSLNKIGKKLFKWHQYSPNGGTRDYYNAALGLFLVIRDKFGAEAIREIILEINKHGYLDGNDLIRISNKVLKTDIEEMASSFQFPKTGLEVEPLTPAKAQNEGFGITKGLFVKSIEPDSPAETARIKSNDVILKIDKKTIRNILEFEMAIFKSASQQNVDVLIWRSGEGEMIRTLQL